MKWDRDGAAEWETFTVGLGGGNKYTLRTAHGKFVSAQPNGTLDGNRDNADGDWENFCL